MEALFESELQSHKGMVVTQDAMAQKKIIGLYFSAHWCPPCREFTPILAQVYEEIQDIANDVEIVFVSYDRDAAMFDDYFGEMPWLALPFARRDLKVAIGKEKYGVRGVPTLIFVNENGDVIEAEGRELVEKHTNDIEGILKALRKEEYSS